MCSNSEAQVDEIVFARDHSGVDGLFVPVMAAKAASSEFGPFTCDQVIRRDDWPEWEVAAEKEIDNLIAHDTFDLVDISEPMNQCAYVYNTKNVFTTKRDGTRGAVEFKSSSSSSAIALNSNSSSSSSSGTRMNSNSYELELEKLTSKLSRTRTRMNSKLVKTESAGLC